ncbi:MAG: hypothetical protein V4572_12035 [Bacteroidota bacterium]
MNEEKDLIIDSLQKVATDYSNSPATTNAGRVLRTIARIIPLSLVIKLFAHKMTKEKIII